MNFHFNRASRRKFHEIYRRSAFRMDEGRGGKHTTEKKNSTRREKKKIRLRSAKCCIRLTWRHSKDSQTDWFVEFFFFQHFSFHSLFCENLFFASPRFLRCFWLLLLLSLCVLSVRVPGEEEKKWRNTFIKKSLAPGTHSYCIIATREGLLHMHLGQQKSPTK